jgi:two-component system LytT family sensor kinase
MQPSETHQGAIRYPRTIALFLACSVMGTLSYGRWYLIGASLGISHPATFVRELLGWLTCYYPWVLLAPIAFRLEHRFPLNRGSWLRSLTILGPLSVGFAYVASELGQVLNLIVLLGTRQPRVTTRPWWRPASADLFLQLGIYATVLATAYLFRKANEIREKEKLAAQLALEKSQLEASLRRAELDNLRMRLNPHFLFNSLQNIAVLAQQDSRTASQMLVRLGDLLRISLRRDSVQETTLEAEVALTKAYVAIEQMRFGGRLEVLFYVADETESALVPTFLLQPLVENAIKHGLASFEQNGVIAIESSRTESSLTLTVRDNGIGVRAESLADLDVGIGLGATSERLQRMYPGKNEVSIRALPEGGTEVRLTFPFSTTGPVVEPSYAEASSTDRR